MLAELARRRELRDAFALTNEVYGRIIYDMELRRLRYPWYSQRRGARKLDARLCPRVIQ